jgi:hypothetical protein
MDCCIRNNTINMRNSIRRLRPIFDNMIFVVVVVVYWKLVVEHERFPNSSDKSFRF